MQINMKIPIQIQSCVMLPRILYFLLLLSLAHSSVYQQYYQEARNIAQAMTIDQKIGQIIQLDIQGITQNQKTNPDEAANLFIGSILVGGNGAPTPDGNMANQYSYLQEQKNIQSYLNATVQNWKKLTDRFKDIGVSVKTKDNKDYFIKLLFGTDAVHGDQHSLGTVLFPHNIGLSCTHNETNFQNAGHWTKVGLAKSGFNYAFAPCVATSHNPQWGRYFQSMGQEPEYIYKYSKAFTKGLQDIADGKLRGPLGSSKHFFGDGATQYGANEGSATVTNFKNFINYNTQGYKGSIEEDIGSVMISYSAINFVPNSYSSYFLKYLLRDQLGFRGFTISDYDEVARTETMNLPRTMMNMTKDSKGMALMINAGVDMIMLSDYTQGSEKQVVRIIREVKQLIDKKLLYEERLQDSVTRILAVKMAMGLVTNKNDKTNEESEREYKAPDGSSGNEYEDSLTAVHQSLVLLKNDRVLPIKTLRSGIQYVVLVGQSVININRLDKNVLFRNFDNIGMQCGGWTVRWQGFEGNDFWTGDNKINSNASSILDALKGIQKQSNFTTVYPNYSTNSSTVVIDVQRRHFISNLSSMGNMTANNTVIIGVFGEVPYAQSEGDVNIKYCKQPGNPACLYNPYLNTYVPMTQPNDLTLDFSDFEKEVIDTVRSHDKNIPLVSVLLTGRPTPIPNIIEESSAVLAAWLPGTSGGQGIIDGITGDYVLKEGGSSDRTNTLSMDWPKSMRGLADFPVYGSNGQIPQMEQIQFKVGHGLSTNGNNEQRRRLKFQ